MPDTIQIEAHRAFERLRHSLPPSSESKAPETSDATPCSLPKQFKGPFYGHGMGIVFIKTKMGDTQVLDIRGWGYLTGRGGGLAMSDDDACKTQDEFEKWVIAALNKYSVERQSAVIR